jgi:hypothetical protein
MALPNIMCPDNKVIIVMGYGLDSWASFMAEARVFSCPQLPDLLWAHPASNPIDTRDSSPGG